MKFLLPGAAHGVDRLPSDQHRHDRGLACAGGELQRETHELGVGVPVRCGKVLQYVLPRRRLRRDLGQPDGRFNRLDLTEERANVVELVVPPMLQQPRCFRRDLPCWSRQASPLVHFLANPIDDRGGIVLLFLGRKSFAFVENNLLLVGRPFSLLRLWDRRDELGAAAMFDDLLRRLTLASSSQCRRG